ncbi:hypothetical protein GPJ56_010845 [Histomonas meleagridis]|uniref:uncharacterized protein n=1 Tax=Histomonas meleagridis TaxID=135588 RepID=UPI003559D2F0|nr:hypothetical protein GPJ56_010845 [Histomonas meleagridis]KAH0803733.1 hypothetical protein GO595_003507 [Histomonas meleagridis]
MFLLLFGFSLCYRNYDLIADDEHWDQEGDLEDECQSPQTLAQFLRCKMSKLTPIQQTVQAPFPKCIINCTKYRSTQRQKCISGCTDLAHSSENAQACILECSDISDPLHQERCINNCRFSSRFDPKSDFSDSCQRCKTITKYVSMFVNSFDGIMDNAQLSQMIQQACTTNVNLMPFCQAASAMGGERLAKLLREGETISEICSEDNLNLC